MPNPFETLRYMDVGSGAFAKHQRWQHNQRFGGTATIGYAVKLINVGQIDYAQADSADNAEVFGIIQDYSLVGSVSNCRVVSQGYIKLDQGAVWPESATFGDILYLSENTAGILTKTAASTNGTINKPVVHCMSTTEGVVVNYRGNVVSSDLFAQAPLLHVRDVKANGSNGGSFTSGAWQTRDLNSIETNAISGASVSGDVITLPSGTYHIEASAPAFYVNSHKTRLQNTTAAVTLIDGTGETSNRDDGSGVVSRSFVSGEFVLSTTSNIELQHRCQTTHTGNGLGVGAGFGPEEVFSDVRIWKVG